MKKHITTAQDTIRVSDRIEKTLFEMVCLVLIAIMAHGIIQSLFLYGYTLTSAIETLVIVIFSILYYLSRFRNLFARLRAIMIFMLLASLIFFWFWLSGIQGPTGIGAGVTAVAVIILAPAKWRRALGIVCFVLVATLVLLQQSTDWVRIHPGQYDTLPGDYLVVYLGLILVASYLKSNYDRERATTIAQNEELIALNDELSQTIQEKEQYIRELKSTQEKLIEAEKMASIGRLTAGIAHELNNPLNYVGGNVRPILQNMEEIQSSLDEATLEKNQQQLEEIQMLLKNIRHGSQHAQNIIGNLMKLSPRQQGEYLEKTELHQLLQDTCRLIQNAETELPIKLIIREPVTLLCNPVEVNQVIINLVKNATEAVSGRRKGFVEVTLWQENHNALLEIKDNGVGIRREHLDHIFEPFFSTKAEGAGTGLGLYISYGIVKKHRGEILVESTPKHGTTVLVKLPLLQ